MMFDEHVPDPLPEVAGLVLLPGPQLPVVAELEGELGQQPQLALDQHPAGGGHDGVGRVPGRVLFILICEKSAKSWF